MADAMVDIIIEEGVKIVFTSAGSPKKYTARFHEAGIKVAHVVSSSKFARKCEEAGVDAVVADCLKDAAAASDSAAWFDRMKPPPFPG